MESASLSESLLSRGSLGSPILCAELCFSFSVESVVEKCLRADQEKGGEKGRRGLGEYKRHFAVTLDVGERVV